MIDTCLYQYQKGGTALHVLVYVDDLIIAYNTEIARQEFCAYITSALPIDDRGQLEWVLRMGIKRDRTRRKIVLSQVNYLSRVLDKFSSWVATSRVFDSPIDDRLNFDEIPQLVPGSDEWQAFADKRVTYVTIVGCLLWLAGGTRPDLTYAASTLARYVSNPGPTHHKAMLRVLAYLHHTRDKVLQISPDSTKHLEIYSDASWCTKNSVSGGIVLYMGAMVGWWSRRQKSIALSSAESEYYAASVAGREGIYYRDLVEDLGLGARKPTPLYLDSKAATLLEIRWLSRNEAHLTTCSLAP